MALRKTDKNHYIRSDAYALRLAPDRSCISMTGRAGDKDGHDAALVAALPRLAQASMARVLPRLPESLRDKFLTSPHLGMQRLSQALAEHAAKGDG